MKKTRQFLAFALSLCMLLSSLVIFPMATSSAHVNPTSAVGDGDAVWDGKSTDTSWVNAETYESTDVFYISSAAQLASLGSFTGDKDGKNVTYSFKDKTIYLTKDIYLNNVTDIVSDSEFTLEGHSDNKNEPYNWLNNIIHGFNGTFDGQGHSVYGLYIRWANQNTGAGLFGRLVNSNATIKNLNVKYCDIVNGGAGAGGIVGQMYRGSKTIENCHVIGKITAATHAGGIFGQSPWSGQNDWGGTVEGCSVRGLITATNAGSNSGAGGITSYVLENSGTAEALIRNCYVYADIHVTGAGPAGGIIGYAKGENNTVINIENCGYSGNISGGTAEAPLSAAGGIIGYAHFGSHYSIVGSYSAATFDLAGVTTYGQLFGSVDWIYENEGVGGRTDPSVSELSLEGTYYLTGEANTAPAAIGANTDEDHFYTSTATPVTKAEATAREEGSLLVRLNEWVASDPDAEMWHIGHHGYPVHVSLPADPYATAKLSTLDEVTTVANLSGAEIKLTDPTESLLRFTAAVKDSYIETLTERHTIGGTAPAIEVGTLLVETADMDNFHVTPSASHILETNIIPAKSVVYGYTETKVDAASGTHYWNSMSDVIRGEELANAYSALSYVKVTASDGSVQYYDAPYDAANNARSVIDVARMAYADRDTGGKTVYSANKFAVIKAYLDQSVQVSMTAARTEIVNDHGDYYANPYRVEKVNDQRFVLSAAHLTETSDIHLVVNGVTVTDQGEHPNATFAYEAGRVTVTLGTINSGVTAIELLPYRVEAWQDLGLDLTLKNTITIAAENITAPALIWSSSNPAVATVDGKGSLTLLSAGVTHVVAMTQDGVISNTVVVTVTAPHNRAADQQISLPSTSTARIDISQYLALPTGGYGDAQIAMWYGNATGAASITIDDSKVGDFADWNTASNNYDLPVTFIAPAHAAGYHASYWQEQIAAGQDVQSHSLIHGTGDQINAMSTAEVWMDYYASIAPIYQVTGQPVEVLGYSFGVGLEEYAGELFISARGTHGTPNTGDKTNYRFLNSSSRGFTDDIPLLVTDLQQVFTAGNQFYGGWYSYHLHGLAHNFAAYTDVNSGMQINTVTDWLNCWFGYYLQPMRDNRSLWMDTYRNVAKYGQERDTATLSIEQNGTDGFSVSIHDLMDDTIFQQALTVKIMVDEAWSGVTATDANGNAVHSELYTSAEGTFVFVDVIPDTGVVTVTKAN